jgi:predicted type IV restriction endonuclease
MNDLAAALVQVRARIAKFGGQTIGEENTKHALIEPVLRALGWDLEDLDEVRCEYKLKQADNPVDYALFVHGGLRLLVEAKALGESLSKYAHQIMGYAGVAGIVEWIVLTDGNEYRIYNAYAPVPIDQKLFKRVAVASDEPGLTDTLGLLSKAQLQGTVIDDLWRAYFVDRQVKKAVEDLAGLEAPIDFVNLVRKRVPALSAAVVRQSLGRATLSLDYPTFKLAPTLPAGPKAPSSSAAAASIAAEDMGDKAPGADKTPWRHVTLKDLISSGTIVLPLDIETTYKGHQLRARIEVGGTVTWNDTSYDSISMAGAMARKSIVGAPPGREFPPTNGWTFWRFRYADGQLVIVDVLRQRHFAG